MNITNLMSPLKGSWKFGVLGALIGLLLGISASLRIRDSKINYATIEVVSPARVQRSVMIKSSSERHFDYITSQIRNELFWKSFLASAAKSVNSEVIPSKLDLTALLKNMRLNVKINSFESREGKGPEPINILRSGVDYADYSLEFRTDQPEFNHVVLQEFLNFAAEQLPKDLVAQRLKEARQEILVLEDEKINVEKALAVRIKNREVVVRMALEKAISAGLDDPDFCRGKTGVLPNFTCYLEAARIVEMLESDNHLFLGGAKYLKAELLALQESRSLTFVDEYKLLQDLDSRVEIMKGIVQQLSSGESLPYVTALITPGIVREENTNRFQARIFVVLLGLFSGLFLGLGIWVLRNFAVEDVS